MYYNGTAWVRLQQQGILQQDFASAPGDLISLTMGDIPGDESFVLGLGDGFLKPPSYTTALLSNIVWPSAGMLIYNTTLQKLMVFDGSGWISLAGNASPVPVSVQPPVLVAGMAINQSSKQPHSVLELGNQNNKTLQLPVVRHSDIYMPVIGLLCFDPDMQRLMVYDGVRWNIIQ
jgi:hypothetical protein